MKLVRFLCAQSPTPQWGALEHQQIRVIHGDPFEDCSIGGSACSLAEARLLAPTTPTKVIAAAINYHGAVDWEPGMTEPLFFLKSPSSVCGPEDAIISKLTDVPVWGEAELAIVIRRRVSEATETEAAEAILGYTVANDVSAENVGTRDHHLARSKAADSFCPLGPYIDTNYDPTNKVIESIHNGRTVRKGSTNDFFWPPIRLVQRLSQWMTLERGDIILTGSPPMIGPVSYFKDGDAFLACVEGFPPLRSEFKQKRPNEKYVEVPLDQKPTLHG